MRTSMRTVRTGVTGRGALPHRLRGFAGLDAQSAARALHDLALGQTQDNAPEHKDDGTARLPTLQELSELLVISTEDTLVGSFPISEFVHTLVRILGGSGYTPDAGRACGLLSAAAAAIGTPMTRILRLRCFPPGASPTSIWWRPFLAYPRLSRITGAIPALCSKL